MSIITLYVDASCVWVQLRGSSYVLSELLVQAVSLIIWFGKNQTRQSNWCLYGRLGNCNGVSHVAVLTFNTAMQYWFHRIENFLLRKLKLTSLLAVCISESQNHADVF